MRSLDNDTKREIGSLLMLIQSGTTLKEPQTKPIKSIHANAHELRVKDKKGIHRIIYVLNIEDNIFIPHAFTKKSQKTPKKEIHLSKVRLKELINETQ